MDESKGSDMIGHIDPNASPKVKTFLLAAQHIVLNPQTADILKQLLSQGQDPAQTLAAFIGKTMDGIETRLGPLQDQEHDQVAVHIAGWLVSSLQEMGMPGLDTPAGRQDLIGRILQALDGMTQGQQSAAPQGDQNTPQGPTQDQQPPPGPMAQFGG